MLRPSNAGDTFETEEVDLDYMLSLVRDHCSSLSVPVVWDPFVAPGSASQRFIAQRAHSPAVELAWELTTHDDVRDAGVQYIVTNPPFSNKSEVLRKLLYLGLPFVVILPTATMQRVFMQEFFKDGNWRIMIPNRFLRFHVGGQRCHSPPFPSAFYFWKPSDHNRVSVDFFDHPS